ncbi:RagB/SusD family nutrient uptake outer membrane protein [Maribacter cobaltidurans]|uniref:RagB/SusD family nutrient uptake outer membrane protein n=1 Tax=Maribacter cobaltidurans TaxID=1178778 RepID=A0A223V752_9FLAO|nr:RagB/SusD family nutrient uptake outer membrane protein [Maribacter cobaltidurans]ASV31037.1 RagB/SusD family nutrient uptake outer membrane protein [Maribacter cobaltidurans]GGD96237.1 membrane protein [Maribacter cobaltidurans]
MKKLRIIIVLGFFVVLSCSKDFLEIPPISSVTVDNLYATDKDYQDAVTGCYAALRSSYDNMFVYGDIRSDDAWHALGNNAQMNAINNFSERSSEPLFESTWRDYFSVVFRANVLLQKIEEADSEPVENKDQYISEAKFLRALAYFDLVRIYGDVPMITSAISIEESYSKGRISFDRIYEEIIIPDLLDAEIGLPVTYTGSDIGRATRGAAKALLGKVYLTRKDFPKAEVKLQEVTTLGYALLPNYNDLFDYTKDEHHSEYIFDIEYLNGGQGLGSRFTNSFVPKSPQNHADNFFGIKGGVGEFNTPTFDLFYAFEEIDPRRTITVDSVYYDNDGIPHKFIQIATFTQKYITPVASLNDSPANWKVLRYADVLLMYAEALNENGKTDQALEYLNQVRTRVELAGYSGLTQDETRNKIYDERRFELGMEGHRWFDLVRTGRALEVLSSTGMKAYNTVFPIPLREVQVMNDPSVFPQNPGYD